MAMVAMGLTVASALNTPRPRIVIPKNQKALLSTHTVLSWTSCSQCPISLSFRISNRKRFSTLCKATGYLNMAYQYLHKLLPDKMKEFPWKKAEVQATQRLLYLGKEAIRYSLAIFLILSPISDVVKSFSSNKELLIPFGLYIGTLAAEFLKEISEEFVKNGNEDWDTRTRLLGIGITFALIKLGLVFLKPPGQILLSHVCNGGLMQVFWLLKKSAEVDQDIMELKAGWLMQAFWLLKKSSAEVAQETTEQNAGRFEAAT